MIPPPTPEQPGLESCLVELNSQFLIANQMVMSLRTASGVLNNDFSSTHFNLIVETAFLRSFMAWEVFLEETFIRYMLGESAPSGFAPTRFMFPRDSSHAKDFIFNNRGYGDWSDPVSVASRARMIFEQGEPYSDSLMSSVNSLSNMKVIRNAVAHWSDKSKDAFLKVARGSLNQIPMALTVGQFLDMRHPRISPPQSFLDYYTQEWTRVANLIVPTKATP